MTCSLQRIVLLYYIVRYRRAKPATKNLNLALVAPGEVGTGTRRQQQSGEVWPPRSVLSSDLAINLLYQRGALLRMGLGNPTFTVDLAL